MAAAKRCQSWAGQPALGRRWPDDALSLLCWLNREEDLAISHQPPEHPWHGALWRGPDYCLVTGKTGQTHSHARYAHQALLALNGDVHARVQGQPQRGPLLLIESMHEHAILMPNQPLIAVYAEPLAFELASLQQACLQAGCNLERLAEHLHHLPRRPLDPRLAKAMAQIRAVGEDPLSADHLAREASLSVSQLERLFSGSLGLSVRRLVLWQRLRRALALALGGSSLTDAAHAAGFSDSAHRSRCIRKQFGIRADRTLPMVPGRPIRHPCLAYL